MMIKFSTRTALLLSAVSMIALPIHAQAADYLFGGSGPIVDREQISTKGETVQIKLDSGALISFVGDSVFTMRGPIVVFLKGNMTVISAGNTPVIISSPGAAEARVTGAASLTADANGLKGHSFGGTTDLSSGQRSRTVPAGRAWTAQRGKAPTQEFAAGPQAVPGTVQNQATGGVQAAAINGVPVVLGDALAAIGARSDIIAAATRLQALGDNPLNRALPSGDVQLLLTYSSELAAALGGSASFNGATPAIISAYLNYLATGGQAAAFQATYQSIVLQYLQLLQTGVPAGGFTGLDIPALNAYIEYLRATESLAAVTGSQQPLITAYLEFIAAGGIPADFIAPANLLSADTLAAYVQLISSYTQFLSTGGNPGDFTGATPAIILQYIAALNAAGILDTLLAEQADVLRDYLAFIQGGGLPVDFQGFGISADVAAAYAASIQQFVVFVLAGGVPSDFSTLNAQVFQAYLEALVAGGFLDDLLTDQADFLRNYLAFLQGGGAFDDFDGLPDPLSDSEKLAQLDGFLAFINGGGLPADYEGPGANILEQFFEDLGLTFANEARLEDQAFLDAYFRFVGNGNNPNTFPALAANGGSTASVQTAYSFVNGTEFINTFGVHTRAVLLDSDNLPFEGLPTNTSLVGVGDNVTVAEYATSGNVSASRLTGGLFTNGGQTFTLGPDQGVHYAFVPAISNLPTNAVFLYEIAAATSPTFADGASAPGLFNADIAIAYSGTEIRLATEGSVVMPSDTTYNFMTAGGLDGVLDLDPTTFASFGQAFIQQGAITLTGTGRACLESASCTLFMTALPGGNGAGVLAVSYESRNGGDGSVPFHGAAAFTSSGTFTPGSGGGNGSGGTPVSTERENQIISFTGPISGIDTRQPATVAYNETSGAPLSYLWTLNDFTRGNENPNIGTAQENESGRVGDIIGWSRWAGGTTAGTYYSSSGRDLPQNSGEHFVSGTPATNLPTSGTVQYSLIGATNPTIRDGSLAPGTFTGDLAVAFGSQPHVGFEFDITIGGNSYAINTPGGVADPMQGAAINISGDERFNMTFGAPLLDVIGTGPVCVGDRPCQANVQGFLAGDGGSHVGVAYTFGAGTGSGPGYVGGVAAFGKTP